MTTEGPTNNNIKLLPLLASWKADLKTETSLQPHGEQGIENNQSMNMSVFVLVADACP